MLRKILGLFKQESRKVEDSSKEIELSKMDRHINFILRTKLGDFNRAINDKFHDINILKDDGLRKLRQFHKLELFNKKIPQREIQIMEGNRENYIKKISHFLTEIEIPKSYTQTYQYTVKFSEGLESLGKEVQKSIFILNQFFENEVKDVNKTLKDIETAIIEIRVLMDKHGIEDLLNVIESIKEIAENKDKIIDIKNHIAENDEQVRQFVEKTEKLNDRIKTITAGTDYKTLESFKKEKEDAEFEFMDYKKKIEHDFSTLETALKKYYYLNQSLKIIKDYMENPSHALMKDASFEISAILQDIEKGVENNSIDLKDKKKEHAIESLRKLNIDYLKEMQSKLLKLEDAKQHAQTKITHNSAMLNLSEQQYWLSNTNDKIKYHKGIIDNCNKDIRRIVDENKVLIRDISDSLGTIMGESVTIIDDLDRLNRNSEIDSISPEI